MRLPAEAGLKQGRQLSGPSVSFRLSKNPGWYRRAAALRFSFQIRRRVRRVRQSCIAGLSLRALPPGQLVKKGGAGGAASSRGVGAEPLSLASSCFFPRTGVATFAGARSPVVFFDRLRKPGFPLGKPGFLLVDRAEKSLRDTKTTLPSVSDGTGRFLPVKPAKSPRHWQRVKRGRSA